MKNIFENKSIKILEQIKQSEKNFYFLTEMKKIGIEKLPYSYSSLNNFIDSKTMDVHYNKHYKGYVKKLNNALSKKEYGDIELEEIIKSISRFNKTIRNNAGGAFNHALFWKMLSPKKQEPKGDLLKKIKKDFGTYSNFKNKFEELAKGSFGSGWIWLVVTKQNKLKLMTTPNQDNPLMNVIEGGGFPILGLDLWEHAYYLKYQNNRDKYISNFWNCVNWEFVTDLYEKRTKTNLNENYFKGIILAESISERCSDSENNFYRKLFNTHEEIKKAFNEHIELTFSQVFPDNYYKRNEYAPNTLRGLYDFMGEPGRSVFNRVNTHYTCFCILVNDINKVIVGMNRPPITFKGDDKEKQLQRLLNAITYFKDRIFDPNSTTFKEMMKMVTKTGGFGESNENYVVKEFEKKFGKENVTKIAEIGALKDTLEGVDCEVNYNGKKVTAQIKPFGSFKVDGDKITFLETALVKKYDTTWLVFTNKKVVYVFDNKNTEIIDGNFVVNKNDLVFKIG